MVRGMMSDPFVYEDQRCPRADSPDLPTKNGHGMDVESMPDDSLTLPRHPISIKPAGNAYAFPKKLTSPFWILPDEIIVQILECLEAKSLLKLGLTCRTFYAFSRFEDFWKEFCISSPPTEFSWHGTWYASFVNLPSDHLASISCPNVFSDVLYRPFLCARTPLKPYTTKVPKQNNIPRLSNLSAAEFIACWTDKPFILTDPVREWPAFGSWSKNALLEKYGDIKFQAEAVDWSLRTYMDYMNNSSDESPLYLFDRSFVEKMDINVGKGGQYWAPTCFGEDLFSILGDDRPDSRWFIAGPERSGSTFHKDPNATSAWNAVLRGSKYWIMFPSTASLPPPPGVYVSADQSEVTSPLSIAEWLLNYHTEARMTRGCMEGICHEGEVLHVPSGWWHLVVNLSPSIAITQNFVPEAHLSKVLGFMKNKAEQISGFKNDVKDPYEIFVTKLGRHRPELLAEAMSKMSGRKRKWEQLVNGDDQERENGEKKSFSFGFGSNDADTDEEMP